jgi:hypothetical protein
MVSTKGTSSSTNITTLRVIDMGNPPSFGMEILASPCASCRMLLDHRHLGTRQCLEFLDVVFDIAFEQGFLKESPFFMA